MQELQGKVDGMYSKLLDAKQQLQRRDAQLQQLGQYLSEAHHALADAGVDWHGEVLEAVAPAATAQDDDNTEGTVMEVSQVLTSMGRQRQRQQQ